MNYTITTSLDKKIINFLNIESKSKNITKKSIIEKGIEYYRKYELENQVKKGFESRREEYKYVNSDFNKIQFSSIKD